MAEEHLSLKWNNHQAHFVDILTFLREKGMFVDVTLACGGKVYSAHKFVLSTCSDYFQKIFSKNTSANPVVFMKDVSCNDIEALLDFMYHGEVNVPQSSLGSLIKTAEGLQIKGLAVPDDPPSRKKQDRDKRERDPSSSSHYESRSPPPKRRSRNSPPRRNSARAIPPPVETFLDNSDADETALRNSPPSTNSHEARISSDVASSNKKLHVANDSGEDHSSDGKEACNKDHSGDSNNETPQPSNCDSVAEQDDTAGPSGLRQSKQEEMEIKQEDVVELGEDDEDGVDWGGGIGDDGGGGGGNNEGLNSGDNSVSFSDVLLPPPDQGGGGGGIMDGGGSGDSAMAGPPPAAAVAPSASFFEDFTPPASHSLDLAAFGSVYQSLFALSGAAMQQSGSAPLHTSSIRSSPENKLKSPTSDGRVRLSGLLPFAVVDDSEERPFPCQFCDSRFKKKQHLQNHERIHTGEKYLCSICGQGFSRRHILKHHIYRKHLNSPGGGHSVAPSGSSPKSAYLAGNSSMSPPSYPITSLLQSGTGLTSTVNNVHRNNPESNGDDASASSNEASALLGNSTADDDSALMDDLPETVASLLSSAAAPPGLPAQHPF